MKKSEIKIVTDITDDMIAELVKDLPEGDKKAFDRFGYTNIAEGLKNEFKQGRVSFMGVLDDRPIAAICVRSTLDSFAEPHGMIWLIAGKGLKKAPVAVLRNSVYYINKLMTYFKRLTAGIDMRNKTNIKYAEFLGFINTNKVETINGNSYGIFIKEAK